MEDRGNNPPFFCSLSCLCYYCGGTPPHKPEGDACLPAGRVQPPIAAAISESKKTAGKEK